MKFRTSVLHLLALVSFAALLFPLSAQETATPQKLSIVFMHDVHSFMDRLARAKTLIDRQKALDPDTLVFDAGDFSMGTLYQTVYETEAVELRTLGAAGVDVTTSGNHEFDYGSKGYSAMLESALAARKRGERLPDFVLCNVDWSKMTTGAWTLKKAFDDYGVRDYIVLNRKGLKIAVFGIFGKDALACAPTCELAFLDPVESAKKTVEKIRMSEKPDLIVCLSHSGTSTVKSQSEDEILAEKVPGIDVIASGHSHTLLRQPIVHGSTSIVSCGEYSEHLGEMSIERQKNGRWKTVDYSVVPLDDSVPASPDIQARLAEFSRIIDNSYLKRFGYTAGQTVAQNTSDLDIFDQVGFVMADCYAGVVGRLECPPSDGRENSADVGYGQPVDVTIVPNGVIRGTYAKGPIDVRSVFNSFSLGIGPDGVPGYPLISVWLSGRDLKNATEVDASLSGLYSAARLYMNGIHYTYNPSRLFLNRVAAVSLVRADGSKTPLEPDRLYRVVSDIYTAQMLGSINKMTMGLVPITPRNADGTPVTDLTKNIIYTKNGELKAWHAIALGLEEMGTVPDQSARPARFRTEKNSRDILLLSANPSKFAILLFAVCAAVVALIALAIVLIVKGRRRRAARKAGRQPGR